jgi:hypothetical protein
MKKYDERKNGIEEQRMNASTIKGWMSKRRDV